MSHSANELVLDPTRARRETVRALMLAALMTCLVITARAAYGQWDWSFFILAGEPWTDPNETPTQLKMTISPGYDGQFFYRLALDPFTTTRTAYGITLDGGAYRQQRILYPLLAHLFSGGGDPTRIPFALILVNALGLCVCVFAFTRIAIHLDQSHLWGLAPLTMGGLWLALGRNLAEPVTMGCVSFAIWAAVTGRYFSLAIALSLAVLARETCMILVATFAIANVILWLSSRHESGSTRRHFRQSLVLLLPVFTCIGVQLWMVRTWGLPGPLQGASCIGRPFHGFYQQLLDLKQLPLTLIATNGLYLGWHVLLGFEVIRSSRADTPPDEPESVRLSRVWLLITWILWTCLATCFTPLIWSHFWSFARVLSPWTLTSLGLLLLNRSRPSRFFSMTTLAMLALSILIVSTRP